MKLYAEPCPCGCSKFIVRPLFSNVDSSLSKEDADELVLRWNALEAKECPRCRGKGKVSSDTGRKGGRPRITCDLCGGKGKVY